MAGSDSYIPTCLHQNKSWAHHTAHSDPSFFPTLAAGQHPRILWLGCSDSRVPETTILGLKPGDVFVHRSIANIFPATDISANAAIIYAVEHVKVSHVIVCGHTSCGGVAAALGEDGKLGLLDAWLAPLRRLRGEEEKGWEREGLGDKEKGVRLAEANVRSGVRTVRENAKVKEAVEGRGVTVHGMIYDVASGELRELHV